MPTRYALIAEVFRLDFPIRNMLSFNAMQQFPGQKQFAFTIVDDTDHATVARVKPIYDLLFRLGFRTTKTVWVLPADPGAHYENAQTLADPSYLDFIRALQSRGFEIALHGIRGCSSDRATIQSGLTRFHELLGYMPDMHINHAYNRDILYWGTHRFSRVRRWMHLYRGQPGSGLGHLPRSSHFWGDLAAQHVRYVRDRIFRNINTLKCDPFMPYHDPSRPFVNAWFSASDGANISNFTRLLSEENQARLESEGGACIVYTHFGTNGFLTRDHQVHLEVVRLLERLASRPGWFPPATTLLDHLAQGSPGRLTIPKRAALLHHSWARW
ncbi:MAG TPA: hypothetical protein VG711_03730 [Phycisphaerales bacterium]|nr:hypothetical protein [Phycisphaerales bacterium]